MRGANTAGGFGNVSYNEFQGTTGKTGKTPVVKDSGTSNATRRRMLAMVIAATSVGIVGKVHGGSFVTSALAPTNADISQTDFSGPLVNYIDYSDNGNSGIDVNGNASYGGVAQTFTPTTNLTLTSFTFKGSGGAGTGAGLSGNWAINVGEVLSGTGAAPGGPGAFNAPGYTFYGQPVMSLYTDLNASGAPIAADVASGNNTKYDTYTLDTPLSLTAGLTYYFGFRQESAGNGAGYYGVATGSGDPYLGGQSAQLNSTGTTTPTGFSLIQQNNEVSGSPAVPKDHTFFINGTPGGIRPTVMGEWIQNGSGAYETPANWLGGNVPLISGDTATFDTYNGTITTSPTVTVNTPITISAITFNAPNISYTLSNAGGGSITIGPSVTVLAGSHTITAPFNMQGSTVYNMSAGTNLTVTNASGNSYGTLTVTNPGNADQVGGGTLNINRLSSANANLVVIGANLSTGATAPTLELYYMNIYNGGSWNINSTVNIDGASLSADSQLILGPTGVFNTQGTSSDYFGGAISGSGSLGFGAGPNGGAGNYTLAGNNSNFSGPMLIANGSTVYTQFDARLGNAGPANIITLDSGGVLATQYGGINGFHALNINSGGGSLNTATYNVQIGSVSGPGTFSEIGSGTLTVAAQVLPLNSSGGIRTLALGGLNISTKVAFASATSQSNRTSLVTGGLSLAGATGAWTSTLDLGGNDMILQNANSVATTFNQVQQGYAGGTWQGSGGIVSSAAAADPTHLTALGVILNSTDGTSGGNVLRATFDGTPSSTADVLVKYTYYGDANLDGKVDGSDYSRIDAAYAVRNSATPLTGWFNGDFNYDGVIDGSDYTLIDNAFNSQGAQLAAAVAATPTALIGGSSAVPEPTTLSLLAIGATTLLGRRRRQN